MDITKPENFRKLYKPKAILDLTNCNLNEFHFSIFCILHSVCCILKIIINDFL